MSLLQMINGAYVSYLRHGANKLWVEKDLLEYEKYMIENELSYHQHFPIAKSLLKLRLSQIKRNIQKNKMEESSDIQHDATSPRSFFCSQLVGAILFNAGVSLCSLR